MHANNSSPNRTDIRAESGSRPASKQVILLLFLAAALAAYFGLRDALSLDSLAEKESQLREYQQRHPEIVYGLAFLVYVTFTGFSLPGAAVLTLVLGWYFGFVRALILVSFASTAGATMAFLLSRFLFYDAVQRRFAGRLATINQALKTEGALYLFTMRLIPAVPFFVINAVMGLTPIRTATFWWVSQLGMLPGTAVYVYAGASVPDLQTLADQGINAVFSAEQLTQIVTAFALLGVFPVIVRIIVKKFRTTSNAASESPAEGIQETRS